jgi:hypothetical protein
MKKALVLFAALVLLCSFGYTGAAEAAEAEALNIAIIYDGYCDGVYLEIDNLTGLVDGEQISPTGCVSGGVLGTVGTLMGGQGPAVTIGYGTDADFYANGLVTVIRANGTWTHYELVSGEISVLNSGTWSLAIAAGAVDPGTPTSAD